MKTSTAKSSFNHLRGLKLAALAIGTSFVLAGCAGNPPTEQYAVTQSAVNSAVSAGGTEYAAVEMKAAQDKLKQAELAMHDKKYDEARRLAEQAEWDARVAERKAQAAKADLALKDSQKAIEELRNEGMRPAVIQQNVALAACSTPPNANLENARTNFSALQANPQATKIAALETKDASEWLDKADKAYRDKEDEKKVDQLAYLTNQRVEVAKDTIALVGQVGQL
eukprot:gene18512-18379_t